MVRLKQRGNLNAIAVYTCLSTDTKPTAEDGDFLIEKDTSKIYVYDADSASWLEWVAA